MKLRKFLAIAFAVALAGAFAGPAVAGPPDPNAKCNSGGGNGSETDPATDCDPGNSGGKNKGGD